MKKTILITGSTDGVGKLTATNLAKEGHEIYLHGRNPEKLSAVISEIKVLSGNENIKGYIADFSDLDAVRQLASQINNELPKVDVLINNAGIYKSPSSVNKDGLDMRFVVNYFAPYILTNELLPVLKKGTDARVINLSSAAQASVSMEALSGEEKLSVGETYAQSKLALAMWSFYLAQAVDDVAVIAVNPGSLLNTKMVKEAFGNSWSSVDKGADILCALATSHEFRGITGKYFDNDRGTFGMLHPDAYDEAEINKLIATTIKVIG